MRRAVRWVLRFLATLATLCVVSVVALVIFVHTDCGRDRVRRTLEDELHATFPGGATIGRLDGSAFGELVAHDGVRNTADGPRLGRIGTLRVRRAGWTLVQHVARPYGQVQFGREAFDGEALDGRAQEIDIDAGQVRFDREPFLGSECIRRCTQGKHGRHCA